MTTSPPFTLTPTIFNLCTQIAERIGRLFVQEEQSRSLYLRRLSRIRTVLVASPHDTPHVTPQVANLLQSAQVGDEPGLRLNVMM
jgi:hypothetical protein